MNDTVSTYEAHDQGFWTYASKRLGLDLEREVDRDRPRLASDVTNVFEEGQEVLWELKGRDRPPARNGGKPLVWDVGVPAGGGAGLRVLGCRVQGSGSGPCDKRAPGGCVCAALGVLGCRVQAMATKLLFWMIQGGGDEV